MRLDPLIELLVRCIWFGTPVACPVATRYIVIASIVMACILMAYIGMACIACIVEVKQERKVRASVSTLLLRWHASRNHCSPGSS